MYDSTGALVASAAGDPEPTGVAEAGTPAITK
jgi:hypothetical protein